MDAINIYNNLFSLQMSLFVCVILIISKKAVALNSHNLISFGLVSDYLNKQKLN